MMLDYFMPAFWGLVVLFSFVGYGVLLRRLLFADQTFGWANEAAWGMAFLVALGGILNLAGVISRPLLIVLVVAGSLVSVSDAVQRRNFLVDRLQDLRLLVKEHPVRFGFGAFAIGCIVVLTGLQYLASVSIVPEAQGLGRYSLPDDFRGYFVFPKQMLEAGGIAADPFDSIRLQNGLAGQAILQALILSLCDLKNLSLLDGGVAAIICAGLVWRIAQERKVALPWKVCLVLFFLLVPNYLHLRINISSVTTGMVVFLALFSFLGRDGIRDETPVRNAFVIALLAASACALKTNLIPSCVIILALSYLWYLISERFTKKAVTETLLVPLFVLIILLPWMFSLYQSSQTMLYPILGMGVDEYNYGNYLLEEASGSFSLSQKVNIITGFLSRDLYPLLFVVTLLICAVIVPKRRAASHAFALGTTISTVMILFKADLTYLQPFDRYLFVPVFVALVVVLSAFLGEISLRLDANLPTKSGKIFVNARYTIALVAIFGTFVATSAIYASSASFMYGRLWGNVRSEVTNSLPLPVPFMQVTAERHRNAQRAVPPGAAIFSRDLYTALYDFNRNRIYNMNDPGSCSPPLGMPYFQGPEAVSSYLLSHGIRYVAYSYGDQAGYPVIENLWRHLPNRPYMHRVGQRAKVALDRDLGTLGATRKRLYDDGSLFVLDLASPAEKPGQYWEPNYFQMGKVLTLAWADTRGFDRNKVWTDGHGVIEGIRYQLGPQDNLLVLNTFGYHPWKGNSQMNLQKLALAVAVNGKPLPLVAANETAYVFSLESVHEPIESITIDSSTFVPREEHVRFGKADDGQRLGIDVDTIQIIDSSVLRPR